MTPTEADDIGRLIVKLFPHADAERAFRLRLKFLESGIVANTARELVFQHRETHEFLTEPHLLTELARVCNPEVDARERARAAAKIAADRRAEEQQTRQEADASWEKLKAWLAKQPPEVVEDLKAKAMEGLPESFAPFARKNPIHPVIAARMVTVFKARMSGSIAH